jgi:hypothetical protein
LKTALMTVGALREVTCRTLIPPSENSPAIAPELDGATVRDADESAFDDARRPDDVAAIAGQPRRVVVRIREDVKRKVSNRERRVRPPCSCRRLRSGNLISDAMIRPGVEVTGRTGRTAVAPNLHVPERSFSRVKPASAGRDLITSPPCAASRCTCFCT